MALSAIYTLAMALSARVFERKVNNMRIQLLAFLMAAAAVSAIAADEAPLTGKWQIQRSAAGNESRQDCTFTQKDKDLTGTCQDERGTVTISGKVEGKKVTWTYKGESPGGLVTVVYSGAVESASKMSGSVEALEYSVVGEFTATRAQ